MKNSLSELTQLVCKFRDERDWKQFHKPKDMVVALLVEAAELAETVQWKSDQEFLEKLKSNPTAVSHELADVLYWVILMAHDFDIDLEQAFLDKLDLNSKKYPVELAKGKSDKYHSYSK